MTYKFSEEKFNNFIIHNNVIGFFDKPLKLKSGRMSYWYVNWRNVAKDVYLIDKLTEFIISYINYLRLKPDCFYGVPEGATKLGIITQLKWAKSQENYSPNKYILPMGRGKPKEHGDPKDRFFLGIPRGKVVILEDTTTTGGSLINCLDSLSELDVKIIAAVVLTDRDEIRDDKRSVKNVLEENGIKYYAMSHAINILPRLNPNKFIKRQIEEYFRKYGTKFIEFQKD